MASKRRIRRKSCTGKRAFVTSAEARHAIHMVNRANFTGTMNAYRCKFCRQFHIGHAPSRP